MVRSVSYQWMSLPEPKRPKSIPSGPTREPLADPGSVMTGGLKPRTGPAARRSFASSVPACVPFGCGSCGSPLEPRSTRVLIRCTSMPCRRAREPGAFAFHGFRCRTTLILADYTDSFRIGLRTAGDEWETGPLLAGGGAAGPRRPFARRDACRLRGPAGRPAPSSHGATLVWCVAVGLARTARARLRLWQHGRHTVAAQSTPGRHPVAARSAKADADGRVAARHGQRRPASNARSRRRVWLGRRLPLCVCLKRRLRPHRLDRVLLDEGDELFHDAVEERQRGFVHQAPLLGVKLVHGHVDQYFVAAGTQHLGLNARRRENLPQVQLSPDRPQHAGGGTHGQDGLAHENPFA